MDEGILYGETIEANRVCRPTKHSYNLTKPAIETTMDLSHHINTKSKARHPSPLKDIIKFMGQDGMISLAGGELLLHDAPS
jgi:uncharacterized protein YutE (UPF0331/DUF86 family)